MFTQFKTSVKKSMPEWLSKKGGGKERKGEEGERTGEKRRPKGMQGEKRNKREVRGLKGGCPVSTAANGGRFILPSRGGIPPGHQLSEIFRTRASSEPTFSNAN